MNQPSNPFFSDDSGLNYMPNCADIERAMVDDTVLEELDTGRLPAHVIDSETWSRIGHGRQRSIPT